MNDTHETVRRLRSETSTLRAQVRDLQAAQDERAGVASETEPVSGGELHAGDSEAARALEEAEYDGWTRDQLIEEILTLVSERDFAYAHVDSWKALLDGARLERDDTRIRLAERDQQVTALTKRLSEGQG